MDKKRVNKCLKKYKRHLDWLDIYEDSIQSNMSIAFDGMPSTSGGFSSTVENKVLKRESKYDEYLEKKAYVIVVKKILNKLTTYEKLIITIKYNLNSKTYLKQYQVGDVPDVEIYTSPDFPYQKDVYYQIKSSSFDKLSELLALIEF